MKTERTKNAARNIFWGLLNRCVLMVMPFITRTVMIHTMGMEYAGLGNLFTSILQVLSFSELGISSAIIFSMYKPVAEGDDKKICELLNFYRKAYLLIGFVILLIGIGLLPFLDLFIKGTVPKGINIQVLFSIYLINNIIGYFLFAYKQSIFLANQRADKISLINTILQFVSGLSQIIILLRFKSYYLYALVIPIITVVNNICVGILTNKYYPQYKPQGKLEKKELKAIEKKVGGMVFQKIGGIILTSVDTLVISTFLGLKVLAKYQNYYMVITALLGIMAVVMQSIIAVVGNSVATESKSKNLKDFKKLNFIYIWIITWCSCCLLCLYQSFIHIWLGKKALLSFGMVILFAVYFYVHKWCDMLYVYQEACGIWWETKFIPLISACINLTLNIILVKTIGLPGILISTIVAVVFIYDIGYARVLFKKYFNMADAYRNYWIRQIMYFISSIIVCCFTLYFCNMITVGSNIARIVIYGIVCVIVPNFIFVIFWKRTEEFVEAKLLVFGILRRKFAKGDN